VCARAGAGVAQAVQCLTTGRMSAIRSPPEAKVFFSNVSVQTNSWAHPASCTMGTVVLAPGAKSGRSVTLTAHPHLESRSRMSISYISSLPYRLHSCNGTALLTHHSNGIKGRSLLYYLRCYTTQINQFPKFIDTQRERTLI
jgi:hypothetical protein